MTVFSALELNKATQSKLKKKMEESICVQKVYMLNVTNGKSELNKPSLTIK